MRPTRSSLVAAALTIASAGFTVPARAQSAETSAPLAATDPRYAPLVQLVVSSYWRPITRDSVEAALTRGGLRALDPYSALMSRVDNAFFRDQIAGAFGGIGVVSQWDSVRRALRVDDTFVRSPALAAGIRRGDVILAIDGAATNTLTYEGALLRLRGRVGSTAAIDIERDGTPMHLELARASIATPSARGATRAEDGRWDYRLAPGDSVGYVRLSNFSATTRDELDSAYAAVERAGLTSLVLDLRGNVGGLMTAALGAADALLDSGVLVSVREHGSETVRRATAGVSTRLPIALLIDGETVSSAEIFASGVQDRGRVVVVGERSFGKGLIQRLIDLPDSLGTVRLSTGAYVRPSGRPIERHAAGSDSAVGGVWPEPRYAVALTREAASQARTRLQEGDGAGALAHGRVPPPSMADDPALARAREAAIAARNAAVAASRQKR